MDWQKVKRSKGIKEIIKIIDLYENGSEDQNTEINVAELKKLIFFNSVMEIFLNTLSTKPTLCDEISMIQSLQIMTSLSKYAFLKVVWGYDFNS